MCFLHQVSQMTGQPLPYVYSVAECLFIVLLLVFATMAAAGRTFCCT
jgi:hypothetical protein